MQTMSIVFHHSKHSAQRRFRTPETATFFNHATAQTEEQATLKRLNANADQAASSRNLHARKNAARAEIKKMTYPQKESFII